MSWSTTQLQSIETTLEVSITTRRSDETLRPWVPIWVVRVHDDVYVRTWYRRDTGWFGRAVSQHHARIRLPGLESDVAIEDLADSSPQLLAAVSDAYRAKYGPSGHQSMVTRSAEATTLRLRTE